MEGKKVFNNTDQEVRMKLDGGASANLMPSSIYRRINPQMFDDIIVHHCWRNLIRTGSIW